MSNGNDDLIRPEIVIQFFDEESVSKYIQKLNIMAMAFPESQPLLVTIDSFGGDIYGLSALYEHIKSLPHTIITYTTSKAMSAGAILLATVAEKGFRMCSPNASIMIHELNAGIGGDMKEMENNMDFLKMENTKWMGILAQAMGLKSAQDVRDMLKANKGNELYLNAQQAKKLGIVDEIGYLRLQPLQVWEIIKTDVKDMKKKAQYLQKMKKKMESDMAKGKIHE